jgi:hypothetical protein
MTVAELNKALDEERELGVVLDDYAGQWVAIRDRTVVASAATLGELVEQVEAEGGQEVEVIQVPRDPAAACFY